MKAQSKNKNFPETQTSSFELFRSSGTANTIKRRIILALKKHPEGLTRRELHRITGIEISSLTYPLKSLQDQNLLSSDSYKHDPDTDRFVMRYKLLESDIPINNVRFV